MARYRVRGPDGAVHVFEGPDGATPEEVTAAAAQTFGTQAPAPAPAGPISPDRESGMSLSDVALGKRQPEQPVVKVLEGVTNATSLINPAGQVTYLAKKLMEDPKGVLMGMVDPVHGGAQLLHNITPAPIRNGVNTVNNWLADKTGLVAPVPDGGVDQMVAERDKARTAERAAAGDAGMDTARLVGNIASPANLLPVGRVSSVAPWLAKIPALERFVQGAAGGAVQAGLQPTSGEEGKFGAEKLGQLVVGGLGGGTLSTLAPRVTGWFERNLPKGKPVPMTPDAAQVAATNMLQSQGLRLEDVPPVIKAAVADEIKATLDAGGKLDPEAVMRVARAKAVGLTGEAGLTAGQATREPMQLSREKNLSGVVLDTPNGPVNPLATRFNNQNQALQQVFKGLGSGQATDAYTAGQVMQDALRASDVPVKAGVDDLYTAARAMNGGRAADLDRAAFVQSANDALDKGMWGRFVPPEVRGVMNDIAAGKAPFNVDAAVQVDGILSAAQRKAQRAGDDAAASALGVIRKSLAETPMAKPPIPMRGAPSVAEQAQAAGVVDNGITDVPYREMAPSGLPGQRALPKPPSTALATEPTYPPPPAPPGTALGPATVPPVPPVDEGTAARQAFDEARKAARARFATIDETPALKAALESEAPDAFVRKYVIGADVRDLEAMKKVLANSPEALAQGRAQLAKHLEEAAYGMNASGDNAFSAERYLKTLQSLGPKKLGVFFTPEEIVQLNNVGRVASDINSIPAGAQYAVNKSGSGAAVFNLLAKLSEAPMLRKIPFARSLANQAGQIAKEREINQALSGRLLAPSTLTPEQEDAIRRLFAGAVPAIGAAGGGVVTQAND